MTCSSCKGTREIVSFSWVHPCLDCPPEPALEVNAWLRRAQEGERVLVVAPASWCRVVGATLTSAGVDCGGRLMFGADEPWLVERVHGLAFDVMYVHVAVPLSRVRGLGWPMERFS